MKFSISSCSIFHYTTSAGSDAGVVPRL